MSRLAYIDPTTNAVTQLIAADPGYDPNAIPVPEGQLVRIGTVYDPQSGNFDAPMREEIAPEPTYAALSPVGFVRLCMSAGGMTPEQLVRSKADANLAAMWIMFEMANEVSRDDLEVAQGLGAMEQLGYLPNGAEAVLSGWPQV